MSVPEDEVRGPFEPILTGRVDARLKGIRRRALELDEPAQRDTFETVFADALAPPQSAPEDPGTSFGDYGTAFTSGLAGVGGAVAGAGEYIADQFTQPGEENPVKDYFQTRRQNLQATARDLFSELSPEAQARAQREILTLDPNKTLFQGGPGEFLSSVGLKLAESAPSTLVTLLPAGLMLRAGTTAGAITYLGASEGGLSLGSIAANIAEEIEQAPEEELLQSDVYRQLREQGNDEKFARQQLIRASQGITPLVGGLVVGAISKAAGRYLTPLFTGGAGLGARIATGAGSESAQEFGQSGAEQIAQNVAAATYDGDRGALDGAAEAALQGAMIGGIMGGGFGALAGRGPAPAPAPTPEVPPAPASFEEVFGEDSFVGPSQYRGADAERAGEVQGDSRGQGLLDLNMGPVNQEIQAAMNARRDGLIQDLFEDARPDPRVEQQAYLENPFPVQQQELGALPQAVTDVVPAPQGEQLPLGLRERVRGTSPRVIEPTPVVVQQDEPLPPEISRERPVQGPLLSGGRPTRADFLRAQQRQRTAELTQGNVTDENQLDLFGAPAPEEDAPSAEPLSDLEAQLQDLEDPDNPRTGVFLSAANIEQLRADGTFERVRGVGVPIANFDGQGGTLIAKDNRTARELLEQRNQGAGTVQEIIGTATLSGTGKPADGSLVVQQQDDTGAVTRESLVSDEQQASALQQEFAEPGRRAVVVTPVQAIRRRNQKIREERRNAQTQRESREVRRRAEGIITAELGEGPLTDKARRKIGRAPLSDNEAARKLIGYAGRLRKRELKGRVGDVDLPENLEFSDMKAAQEYKRLFGEYRDASISREMATTAEASLKARARQEGLRRQIGAFRRVNKTTTAAERVARAARKISLEEVEKVEREARETRNPRRRPPKTEGDILGGATRTVLERATEEQLLKMSDDELNLLFVEAANFYTGSRASRSTRSGPAGETTVFEVSGKKLDEVLANVRSRSEKLKLIRRVRRSLKRAEMGGKAKTRPITSSAVQKQVKVRGYVAAGKPIRVEEGDLYTPVRVRYSPGGKERANRGAPYTPVKVGYTATEPGPVRTEDKLYTPVKMGTKSISKGGFVRRGTLDLNPALDLNPPREMSSKDQREYDARVTKAQQDLGTATAKLITIDNSAQGFGLDVQRDAKGNPTAPARDAIYGRTYLKTLIRYGQLLQALNPKSRGGLKEVQRFTKIAEDLAATAPDKLAAKLARLTEAEIVEQAKTAARVDPVKLGRLSERKQAQAQLYERNAKARQRVAAAKRLHELYQANPKYEQFVAPLIQKLVGYVTFSRTSLAGLKEVRRGLGYKPTFTEMRNLRYALREFKSNDALYKPLKRWFTEYGFKFDSNGDLKFTYYAPNPEFKTNSKAEKFIELEAKNSAEFRYTNDAELLRKARNPTAYRNAPLNYNQKVAKVKRDKRDALIAKERARRQELSDKQRAREDKSLADRIERERRKDMTPEQRRLLSSLDARNSQYRMAAVNIKGDPSAIRAAAEGVATLLESRGDVPAKLTDALQVLSANLPPGHPYQEVLQRLMNSQLENVAIRWSNGSEISDGTYGDFTTVEYEVDGREVRDRVVRINRNLLERKRTFGGDPTLGFVHTVIHESVHAATIGAIYNNPAVAEGIQELMEQVRKSNRYRNFGFSGKLDRFYGMKPSRAEEAEFIAEVFSNIEFQEYLARIPLERTTLWQEFLELVRRILGLPTRNTLSALDVVMRNADSLFTGEIEGETRGVARVFNMRDTSTRGVIGNVIDKVMQSARITDDLRKRATNTLERSREGGNRATLSATTMEQIRDFYANDFGGSGGPLAEYMKAFFRRNADNSANMELPDKLSRKWTTLGETDPESDIKTSQVMTEATLYGIAPDRPLTAPVNAKVTSPAQRQRYQELAKKYQALPESFKKLYQEVQSYYQQSLKTETSLMVLNALRGVLGSSGFKYTEADVQAKKLDTDAGLQQEFGDRLSDNERTLVANLARVAQLQDGPYFPLMRPGDYVVTAERTKETKVFTDYKSAKQYAAEVEASDPTLSVSFPTKDKGGYRVTVREKEVRMTETISEAEENRKEMIQAYGAENVDKQVQKKSQLFAADAAINSTGGLRTILGKLEGNPAAQAAIKDFYLRSLGDRSFRKREIARANRRGVNSDLQQRTFRKYARSSAYYTSQLRFGWKMAEELGRMDQFAKQVASGEQQSGASAVRLAEVVSEIVARDKMATDPYELSKIVQKATELTQFMLLASPSYAMVNATQPYMVSLPWLAARTSLGDATAALLGAQRMIAAPVVNQAISSAGGLRALWSRTAGEKAFSVLEQVEQYIKQKGGARADEYINMLNKLKRESIIDFTMITELRDVAQGQRDTLTRRVLDASRIMGHLTEVNNRIVTAVAAYDLARNRGQTVQQAEGFAQQAVSTTQFNYSPGNSPRLFNGKGPLGRMGPLVFQFMKYPQHIYAMLIDNFRRAVWSGGMDRKVAIKTLAGLFATHLAAAGAVGAMLQPIKWAIGLTLAAFGDEDEPYTIKNALSGATFDRLMREGTSEIFGNELGEIMSQGLPRAVGVDLSNRLSLGSLYFIDLRTDTAESTLGSLLTSFGGPTISIGAGFMRGAQYMREGETAKALEYFLPKGGKDALQAVRFSQEGLTDASGKEIIGAEQMTPWQLFTKSIGFQPGEFSEAYARRTVIKDAMKFDDDRRDVLLRRIQRADTPEERTEILQEISQFNQANPGAYITRSQILKSIQGFRQRSQRAALTAGLELRGDDILYAEEGEPYEDEEE